MRKFTMLHGKVNLAKTLEQLRGSRSRAELANLSGVSAATIADIEYGKSPNPTIGTLLSLCGALKVSPIEFLKDAYPDLHKVEPIIVENRDAISLEDLDTLINGFSRASSEKRGLVRMLLSPAAVPLTKHFREGGKMSIGAFEKLRELLTGIEKLIRDDQASRR